MLRNSIGRPHIGFLLEEYKVVWGEANRQNDQSTLVHRFSAAATVIGVPVASVYGVDVVFAILPFLLALGLSFLVWKELMWNVCLIRLISIEREIKAIEPTSFPIDWATVTTLVYQRGEVLDSYAHYQLPLIRRIIRSFYYFIGIGFLVLAGVSAYLWLSSLSSSIDRATWAAGYLIVFVYMAFVLAGYQRYLSKVRSYLYHDTPTE